MVRKAPLIGILNKEVSEDEENIILKATCVTKFRGSRDPLDTGQLRIDVAMQENAAEIKWQTKYGRKLTRGFRLNSFCMYINKKDALKWDIQNKLILKYQNEYEGRILYSLADMKKGHNRNSKVFVHDGITMYFRQSKFNSLGLTVRDTNQYDYPEGQERIKRAYKKAKKLRNNNSILMYEKNCSRYEESASVLFQRLIDAGYENVYYVVNFDNPEIQKLDEKYRRHMVEKDSDRHLELFFESNTYVATESTEHALQLRIASKLVMDKIRSKDLKYVFLQHGVMYMVSLNSELRTGFRNSDIKLQRTVVSSEIEAQHFIDLAGMTREDLYVTGLATFDKSVRNPGADKIVIMPTWRRWETNQARDDLKSTNYYKMIMRMFNAIPDELKNKVIILPHPLMSERFKNAEDMGGHIVVGESYDKILRQTDLLITDYSSISYDAFYRGANIIFCWEEKDECMEHYGEGSYLMLNEDNAFGDICMNETELTEAIRKNYAKPQAKQNIEKYSKIVEFHDGHNTDRIIECMKKDGILE